MLPSVPDMGSGDPPPALLWVVGLPPHPRFQPWCFSQSLLVASGNFEKLACHPIHALSLYAYLNLCWVPAVPLGGWLVTLPPFSAFVVYPR
jgi:hypothetical protein